MGAHGVACRRRQAVGDNMNEAERNLEAARIAHAVAREATNAAFAAYSASMSTADIDAYQAAVSVEVAAGAVVTDAYRDKSDAMHASLVATRIADAVSFERERRIDMERQRNAIESKFAEWQAMATERYAALLARCEAAELALVKWVADEAAS